MKRDMDLIQDRKYINSSFMSDYHLDLSNAKLHFWHFIELIEGLTEGTILSRVREIRNIDLSTIKDVKERKRIQETQKQLALKSETNKIFTQKQKDNIDNFYKQAGIERGE